MKCCNCGREILSNSIFCNQCGAKQISGKEKLLTEREVDMGRGSRLGTNKTFGFQGKSTRMKILIVCAVCILIGIAAIIAKNQFMASPLESNAIRQVEKLQEMLKDPDSMMIGNVLNIMVIFYNEEGDLDDTNYTYIEYRAKNSYGAYSGNETVCFEESNFLGNIFDEERVDELLADAIQYDETTKTTVKNDEIFNELLTISYAKQYILGYKLYGQEYEEKGLDEKHTAIRITFIPAKKAARMVGCKPIE